MATKGEHRRLARTAHQRLQRIVGHRVQRGKELQDDAEHGSATTNAAIVTGPARHFRPAAFPEKDIARTLSVHAKEEQDESKKDDRVDDREGADVAQAQAAISGCRGDAEQESAAPMKSCVG